MADTPSPNQHRHPNMIGAGLLAGLLAGTAMGGVMDDFGVWVSLLGAVGLVVGLLLHIYDRNRT